MAAGGPTDIVRRSFRLILRRTSIALHRREWELVEELAARRGRTLKQFLLEIEANQGVTSLPSAIRMTLLDYWRDPDVYEGRVVRFQRTANAAQPNRYRGKRRQGRSRAAGSS